MPSEFTEPGADAERVIARLRPHARVLFWPSLLLIVGAAAIGYFQGSFPEDWQNLALLAGGGALLLLLWLGPLFRWLGKRYIITTRRLILRSGTFTRTRLELLHSRGYDITVRKGALQSMFGSGDVLINTGLDHPVELRDVPNADLVQSTLHDLMERSMNPIAARRQADLSNPVDETKRWGSR
ncbi:MAG: PH domain-containing protein [Homoserinimonas sp.]